MSVNGDIVNLIENAGATHEFLRYLSSSTVLVSFIFILRVQVQGMPILIFCNTFVCDFVCNPATDGFSQCLSCMPRSAMIGLYRIQEHTHHATPAVTGLKVGTKCVRKRLDYAAFVLCLYTLPHCAHYTTHDIIVHTTLLMMSLCRLHYS